MIHPSNSGLAANRSRIKMLLPPGIKQKPLGIVTVRAFGKLLALCVVLSLCSCASVPRPAYLYNLKTDNLINLEFDYPPFLVHPGSWDGMVKGVLPNGGFITGEYHLIYRAMVHRGKLPNDEFPIDREIRRTTPAMAKELIASGDYEWAAKLGFKFINTYHYTAKLVSGDKKLECLYRKDIELVGGLFAGNRSKFAEGGFCRDNKGGAYRLVFSIYEP
jgi:hypothetical protein